MCYSLLTMCKIVMRVMFVVLNNMYCIPTYAIWMILLSPLKRCHPKLYWRVEGVLFHWLLAMVSMWSWSAGYDSEYCLASILFMKINTYYNLLERMWSVYKGYFIIFSCRSYSTIYFCNL